ncbi:(2Fe-2S) ferredoxin domain-containing protein [Kamptonema cortianum]|nr:(2Fe-2S) ferredoxin domain-containing protein [Oscillatoria laete-virens]MDK3160205.1 (2Fe-2S) ferredoxin domain-containing protein [Kamptonema cortianum]MDL5055647.1 (2Fe-2S) ferredoxin domain-containing protein [Oscillatoria laete-virens NRMC-F 0139]
MDDNPKNLIPFKKHVFVCNGKSCAARGSGLVKERFIEELRSRNLLRKSKIEGDIMCTDCSSVGFCEIGPAVLVYPDGLWYAGVTPEDVPRMIEEHLLAGRPLWEKIKNRVPSEQGEPVRPE